MEPIIHIMWQITSYLLMLLAFSTTADLWEQELGKEIYLEASVDGLTAVQLECSKDKMQVSIDLEEEGFDGVVYTRGSYQMGKRPCFYDAQGHSNEKLTLQWSFDECKTQKWTKEDDVNKKWSNTIIVQQDDLLMFPGDMAFDLSCEGSQATIGCWVHAKHLSFGHVLYNTPFLFVCTTTGQVRLRCIIGHLYHYWPTTCIPISASSR